ncbi:MAG TPA: phytanoyl-CoA dioxygenase family protein [Chloroflexota bacterium]|nr:phytanoyl-CoA dioxygenase family protein [Chloroflexota bacterium]
MTLTITAPLTGGTAADAAAILRPPAEVGRIFDDAALERYARDGFVVAKSLFSKEETEGLRDHYMRLRLQGSYTGDFAGVPTGQTVDPKPDPLVKYPRMIHMHRWDEVSLRWLVDARIGTALRELCGVDPFAVQTMIYFKPAGARGQAMHQDQFYLRVQPGTCMAAWMALDPCDEDNGCMKVVPGTQNLPVLCTERANTVESFTDTTVPIPPGKKIVPVRMDPGDVFFFNGSLIHGSGPNFSADRFRRSLIGHYITGDAAQVSKFYHPVLRMDGSVVDLGVSERGGPCGRWVGDDGEMVELFDPSVRPEGPDHE